MEPWQIVIPVAVAISFYAGLWLGGKRAKKKPVVRRTVLTEQLIEPERDGQHATRNPDSESHRRKTFSTKRRGGTDAHFSQPRRNW